MNNAIYRMTKDEYALLKERINTSRVFIGEIQGEKIQNHEAFLREVWEKFNFPQTGYINHNAYLDWIRDLAWLNRDSYIMAILDFNKFLLNDPELKKEIIEDFTEEVIPWWQGKVEQHVVDGKAKPFNLYLVD